MKVSPIVKVIRVAAPAERAFRFFTERMAEWWPFAVHSVLQAERVRFEGPVGPGAVIAEIDAAGEARPWGRVTVWEPPRRLVIAFGAWAGWDRVTDVELHFIPDGDGTRVELEHRDWPGLVGGGVPGDRASYEQGWAHVTGAFESFCMLSAA